MARKSGPTIFQEELYPPSAEAAREEMDDSRLFDLDVDEESPFLRGQKRVSARRSSLPKKTANRLVWAAVALPETRSIHHAGEAGFANNVRALLGSGAFHGYVLAGGFGSASYFAFLGGGPHVTVTVQEVT